MMIRLIFTSLIALSLLTLTSCKPSGKSAARYNNEVVKYQARVGVAQQELMNAINSQKTEEMRKALSRFQAELKTASDSVAAMKEFDGKNEFRQQVLNYFSELNAMSQNECEQVVKMYDIPDSLFTEGHERQLNDLLKNINAKTSTALKSLETEQDKFAREYNFDIVKK